MGDSEDEYNTISANNNNNNNNNNNGNSSNNNIINSNIKRNRDKFYRERDEISKLQSNTYPRRDWSSDNIRKDSWKNKSITSSNNNNNNINYQQNSLLTSPNTLMQMQYNQKNNPQIDYQRKYNQMPSSSSSNYDLSPPHKRNKKEWENGDYNRSLMSSDLNYASYGTNQQYCYQQQSISTQNNLNNKEPDYPTQPPCLTFKQFLQQEDNNISEEDAVKKYKEYRIDFLKIQINDFFLSHKEEEWFKARYHPDEYYKRYDEHKKSIVQRLDVFIDLYEKGWIDNVRVEVDKSNELINFLDAAVIKMEGGDDFDLQILNSDFAKNFKNDITECINEHATKNEEKLENKEIEEKENKNRQDNNDNENNSGSESGAYSDTDDEAKHKKSINNKELSKSKLIVKSYYGGKEDRIPRALHRTTSLFLRNLHPSVTKEDLESLFKKYNGFKRVALSDPAPERGFFRRGWATFDSNVNIKDICWSLNNVKLYDHNLGAIVNRDLNRRVRPISSYICHHNSVIRNDIKIATKIIENMDKRWSLWNNNNDYNYNIINNEIENDVRKKNDEKITRLSPSKDDISHNDDKRSPDKELMLMNKNVDHKKIIDIKYKYKYDHNPLLENITDYLVDEINAEEEELLGGTSNTIDNKINEDINVSNSATNTVNCENNCQNNLVTIEIDDKYKYVLDKLILYLRVVHSIDFYNTIEYQQEDSMPNRCGIIHARASLPAIEQISLKQSDINKYVQQYEQKMKPYIEYKEQLDEETAKKLGYKDVDDEIEKFVKSNTQELAPDRWLCPLSGKKFKGPEFIRKHLFYKHADKITDVKKEVEYFNNYILDPKRPQLPDHPSSKSGLQQNNNNSTNQQNTNLVYNTNTNTYNNVPLLSQYIMPTTYGSNLNSRQLGNNWQSSQMPLSQMSSSTSAYIGRNSYNTNSYHASRNTLYSNNINNNLNRIRSINKEQREIIHYKDLDAPDDEN